LVLLDTVSKPCGIPWEAFYDRLSEDKDWLAVRPHLATTLAITTVVIAQVLFATIGLARLSEPSAKVLIGVQVILATTQSTVAWMVWLRRSWSGPTSTGVD